MGTQQACAFQVSTCKPRPFEMRFEQTRTFQVGSLQKRSFKMSFEQRETRCFGLWPVQLAEQ